MLCVANLFMGDVGTSIEFLIKECDNSDTYGYSEKLVDVSTVTFFELTFLKPDDTVLVKTTPDVKFLTDGADLLVHYLTVATDLDQAGKWKAQLRLTMPSGKWYSNRITFQVKEPIG